MAQGDKKIKLLSPLSCLGQKRVRTQQLHLILKEIMVDSYTTDTASGALSCSATIPPLLNAQYLRADQEYLSPGMWVTSQAYILKCKQGMRRGGMPARAASALLAGPQGSASTDVYGLKARLGS